jgi:signal transduction histidine kinase
MDATVAGPSRANVMRYAAGVGIASALTLALWPGFVPALFGTGKFLPHSFCYLRDPATATTGVVAIEQSARAQAQLIDDLLDVSRIVTGKLALEPQQTELANVVRAAIDTIAFSAEKKKLKLELVLPAAPVTLLADAARLHQVVTNLLSNAVKFTPAAGRVRIELSNQGGDALIDVSDSGIGIDPQFMPYVFNRFTQADESSTRGFGGLGLGLAIVRHLVELHGGTVHARSDGPGTGSTFTVRLPLVPAIALAEYGHARRDVTRAQPQA